MVMAAMLATFVMVELLGVEPGAVVVAVVIPLGLVVVALSTGAGLEPGPVGPR